MENFLVALIYSKSRILLISFQIRRQARLRREYLYRKGVEERQKAIQDKKDRLKKALEGMYFQLGKF